MTPLASQRFAGLAPVRRVLDNGAVVLAKDTRTTPAVTINARFHAGNIFDPDRQLGLANFVARTIDRGTARRSADEIAEELDNRSVSLAITVTRHVVTLVCTCLSEDFEPILDVVGDVARRPTFSEPEIEKRRAEIVTGLRQDEDNPAAVATERLMRLLYPAGHPYGRRGRGTVASVERIARADLARFHAERYAPAGLSLAIVGDVDPARAIAAAADVFGDWHVPPPAGAMLPPAPRATRRRQVAVPMMNKAQADLAYGFVAVTRTDPAYHAWWVMNNVLGQYALGGRLGDSIRERQGMAYYVFSTLDANVIEGPLMVRAGVAAANVERALESIDREMRAAAREGFTEQEVEDSKRYLIGSLPRTLETNAGIATFLQTAEFFGIGADYDARLPGLLGAVTRDDVAEAARRVLDADTAAVAVAGPFEPTPGARWELDPLDTPAATG